ncbi:ABC transporter ATP-binding protein [Owenweeksia hongkongensis]|uniref:ABC transporter ATP-binding protein n=1 Tax=Owenweeksia hongkongensis TaxID=253245 RepID=UPI003A947D31
MINLHHISKIYKSNSVETHALSNVSLEVAGGEFVSIMGPSGCGKTTLLNIMGLLDGFDQGLYVFDSTDVKKLNEKSRVKLRKSNIGFIFQNFNLLDDLTVFENIELPLVYLGVKAAERRERVKQVLHQIALGHRMDHFPHQLSGGQQQKVAIGRAIVSKPRIILADEPTGNLDSAQGNEIMETLSSLNEAGTTLVMVTHSMNDASYSNRIVKLMDGQIVAEKALLHA